MPYKNYRSAVVIPIILLLALLVPDRLIAQSGDPDEPVQSVSLSLDDAVQIALENNYAVRGRRLDIDDAEAQIRETRGTALPQVSLSSQYTRNLKTANPFAGSSAGSLFGGLAQLDWLAYNEQARSDTDPTTDPLSLDEFRRRQSDGIDAAGITVQQSDNPFAVDNQFTNSISISQTIYDPAVFTAIRAAKNFRILNQVALDREAQLVVQEVRQAFYQAQLAVEQANVVQKSITRTAVTVQETQKRLAQGVASKYQRLSAEVELANLESQYIQVENQAGVALNNLKMVLGLPIEQPITLRGSLESEIDESGLFQKVGLQDAVARALTQRPDLQQADLAIELQRLNRSQIRAGRLPTLSAFASLGYTGNVPDVRSIVLSDPDDPFTFSQRQEGFFSDSYWNPSVAVGFSVNWNIFTGFQNRSRIERATIEVQKAELNYEQLYQSINLEVDQALRSLEAAQRRIDSQLKNIERAELNYEFAVTRLREGVGTSLEERQASELLDQSRLNQLQAVYDYLVAQSNYDAAVGAAFNPNGDDPMTQVVPGSGQ